MWYTEFRIEAQVPKESIWQLWKDVENWNKWDGSVEYAKINGEFITGATGTLKPNGGPKTKFKITEAIENSSFLFYQLYSSNRKYRWRNSCNT